MDQIGEMVESLMRMNHRDLEFGFYTPLRALADTILCSRVPGTAGCSFRHYSSLSSAIQWDVVQPQCRPHGSMEWADSNQILQTPSTRYTARYASTTRQPVPLNNPQSTASSSPAAAKSAHPSPRAATQQPQTNETAAPKHHVPCPCPPPQRDTGRRRNTPPRRSGGPRWSAGCRRRCATPCRRWGLGRWLG